MRVGINLLPYGFGHHGGAEVYLRNIIPAMGNIANRHEIVLLKFKDRLSRFNSDDSKLSVIEIPFYFASNRMMRILSEQMFLPFICRARRIDCLVSNYVVPIFSGIPNVVILHDMLLHRYPEVFEPSKLLYWKIMIPASIRHSKAVVTVSRFSAQEITTFYPKSAGKIFTTVEGVRPSLLKNNSDKDLTDNWVGIKYLLSVATFGKHKNLLLLLKAFSMLPEDLMNLSLILVGAARTPEALQYQAELRRFIDQAGLAEKIKFAGHISDAEMAVMYRHALACILPSLYEGFGLPIIEAQTLGCPVICSDTASLPEVAGGAALLFDPSSPESLRDRIIEVARDPARRHKMVLAGFENASKYTWEKAAFQLVEAINFATGRNC